MTHEEFAAMHGYINRLHPKVTKPLMNQLIQQGLISRDRSIYPGVWNIWVTEKGRRMYDASREQFFRLPTP